ncbi:MAG: hypothetical protein SAJ37_07835 [Oscillatoria sp. PMC 1068.18]|nr:hypothetical protein [Oscillatoria sp. PMC 1076.18]MEC4988644.1 hypothetical protein [Oscillatoria sp. PMC 1068.18]
MSKISKQQVQSLLDTVPMGCRNRDSVMKSSHAGVSPASGIDLLG